MTIASPNSSNDNEEDTLAAVRHLSSLARSRGMTEADGILMEILAIISTSPQPIRPHRRAGSHDAEVVPLRI